MENNNKMKNNSKMKIENEIKNNITKTSLEVLLSKVPSLGVLSLKNDYRSVINITFIPIIVHHMLAIS